MADPARPQPQPDPLSQPFWDAAAAGRLAIQRCDACDYYSHPPRPLCPRCSSAALAFVPVSGRGRVYTFTTNHQRNVAGFEAAVPYCNLVVELDEQPRLFLISDVPAADAGWVEIGASVEVCFEPLADGLALPQFRPPKGGR